MRISREVESEGEGRLKKRGEEAIQPERPG